MLRLTNLANKYQRRTLRVLYGSTQAYPYDVQLDSAFDRTAGALSGANAITGAKSAILPGQVAVKKAGELVTVSGAAGASQRAFGLFANFVGGELSDIPTDFDRVGIWRGVGSVYEILAPAFDDTNLPAETAAEAGTVGTEVYLNSSSKGVLVADAAGVMTLNDTARAINRLSANAVIVELLV
jgi:hypothetical protein